MPHIKVIEKITEIQDLIIEKKSGSNLLFDTFDRLHTTEINKELSKIKGKGYSPELLFSTLLFMSFFSFLNIWNAVKSGFYSIKAKKDSYYRFLNDSNINWRKILYLINKSYNRFIRNNLEVANDKLNVFIIDDSDIPKTGRKIEFIGKVFSHVHKKSILGFKILVLGYWDGINFRPLDFSMHREKGKKTKKPYGMSKKHLKERFSKERVKKYSGYKRVQELNYSKIKNSIIMLKRAIKHGYTASYVLVDSWFMSASFIKEIRKMSNKSIDILGACRLDKRKYQLSNGERYNGKELIKKLYQKKKGSNIFKSLYIEVDVDYQGTNVKLFFSKFKGDRNWKLFLTTNMNLTYEEAMKIYTMRWTIEVFFREAKQLLRLGKNNCSDFDGQIGGITISMIQYIILTLHKRINTYETMYGLFKEEQEKNRELVLAEKIWDKFLIFMIKVIDKLKISFDNFTNAIIEVFYDLNIAKYDKIMKGINTEYLKIITT